MELDTHHNNLKEYNSQFKPMVGQKEGFINEAYLDDQVNELENYRLEKSTSSCHIDDIEAFALGGCTSRWWMMRKHINLMSLKDRN